MTNEKLVELNRIHLKMDHLRQVVRQIQGKTRTTPLPGQKMLYPWRLHESDAQSQKHQLKLMFKGGQSEQEEYLHIDVPQRLAENFLRDLENFYTSELQVQETHFERL